MKLGCFGGPFCFLSSHVNTKEKKEERNEFHFAGNKLEDSCIYIYNNMGIS